jgi:menaquinone-9 beta-reductase
MRLNQEIDLLIIGSGPAGLSTALHLLKNDNSWADRMLILEKDSHPRPKICGGGVTRLGLDLLKDLGFELPLPIPQALVDDVRLIYEKHTIHVRGKPQFSVFHRADFDAYLAQATRQSGAVIKENEAAQSLETGETRVTVTSSDGKYHAKTVVVADGSKGIIRKLISGHRKSSRVARLLKVLKPVADKAPPLVDRYALFDFTPAKKDLQGYSWVFPERVKGLPHLNCGVYDARIARKRPAANLPKVLEAYLQLHLEESGKMELLGHPIHQFSPTNHFSAPRILLVGDSAGVDPLFGEGIGPALAYGNVAATTLRRAFRTGDFSFRDYRRRILTSRLGRYLTLRWFIAWTCYHLSGKPQFMQTLWAFGDLLSRIWPQPKPEYENIYNDQ